MIRKAFDVSVNDIVNSGDESIQSALAMFDETPRWRRAELGLSESSAKVLAKLREQHDVEVLTLSGEEATMQDSVGHASSLSSQDAAASIQNPFPVIETFSNITDLSSGIAATQKATASTTESEDASSSNLRLTNW